MTEWWTLGEALQTTAVKDKMQDIGKGNEMWRP